MLRVKPAALSGIVPLAADERKAGERMVGPAGLCGFMRL